MVVDALTKSYGSLTHWRQTSYLIDKNHNLSKLRDIVLQKYSKRGTTTSLDLPTKHDYEEDISGDVDCFTNALPIGSLPTASTSQSSFISKINLLNLQLQEETPW